MRIKHIWLLLLLIAIPTTHAQPEPPYGYIDVPFTFGDGGIVAIEAGETVTVNWVDPPEDAIVYIFILARRSRNQSLIMGQDTDASDGVSIEWTIPEFISGDPLGYAIYPDGETYISGGSPEVVSQEAIPEGMCAVRSGLRAVGAFVTPIAISPNDDPYSLPEFIDIYTGLISVTGQSNEGWLQLNLSNRVNTNTGEVAPDNGWTNLDISGGILVGDCDDLPFIEIDW